MLSHPDLLSSAFVNAHNGMFDLDVHQTCYHNAANRLTRCAGTSGTTGVTGDTGPTGLSSPVLFYHEAAKPHSCIWNMLTMACPIRRIRRMCIVLAINMH